MWIYNYAGVQRGEFTALHLMRTAERAQRRYCRGVGQSNWRPPGMKWKNQPTFVLALIWMHLMYLSFENWYAWFACKLGWWCGRCPGWAGIFMKPLNKCSYAHYYWLINEEGKRKVQISNNQPHTHYFYKGR